MNTTHSRLGFTPWFEALYLEKRKTLDERLPIFPARIVMESRGHYWLKSPDQDFPEAIWGELRGTLLHSFKRHSDHPSTGDWVLAQWAPDMNSARILAMLERRTGLVRRAAGERAADQVIGANIDHTWIATSLNRDLNLRRIERYLALAWDAGTRPALIITKIDLVAPSEIERAAEELRPVTMGVELHWVSSQTGTGISELLATLTPGDTAALIGSSGVGKSTLANLLLGSHHLETQAIRDGDDRGRHTTTARHLMELPNGALLMDTPGMRELALAEHASGISASFAEIEEFERHCRFTDCRHETEPGCAVNSALASGELDRDRIESRRKLQREAEFESRRGNRAAESEARKQWKKIGAQARSHVKRKRWEE